MKNCGVYGSFSGNSNFLCVLVSYSENYQGFHGSVHDYSKDFRENSGACYFGVLISCIGN